jgi:hypothetical protein
MDTAAALYFVHGLRACLYITRDAPPAAIVARTRHAPPAALHAGINRWRMKPNNIALMTYTCVRGSAQSRRSVSSARNRSIYARTSDPSSRSVPRASFVGASHAAVSSHVSTASERARANSARAVCGAGRFYFAPLSSRQQDSKQVSVSVHPRSLEQSRPYIIIHPATTSALLTCIINICTANNKAGACYGVAMQLLCWYVLR